MDCINSSAFPFTNSKLKAVNIKPSTNEKNKPLPEKMRNNTNNAKIIDLLFNNAPIKYAQAKIAKILLPI